MSLAVVPAPRPLRLSVLLRYSLTTARKGRNGLLPERIPFRCCTDLFHCHRVVKFRVSDGVNAVFFCQQDFEEFVKTHDIFGFHVMQWSDD